MTFWSWKLHVLQIPSKTGISLKCAWGNKAYSSCGIQWGYCGNPNLGFWGMTHFPLRESVIWMSHWVQLDWFYHISFPLNGIKNIISNLTGWLVCLFPNISSWKNKVTVCKVGNHITQHTSFWYTSLTLCFFYIVFPNSKPRFI